MFPETKSNTVFLIDGSALAYRSHFSFIKAPLINSKGFETSAVYGFTSALMRLIKKERPQYIGVVFDAPGDTFRHTMYPQYKATRDKMPEELKAQIPYIRQIVEALNICYFAEKGFEADDVIGTLAKLTQNQKIDTFLHSGDKDFMQLIGPQVKMYTVKKGSVDIVDESGPRKKWGIGPEKVIDFMALIGDSSDNVPGVPGIGPKTAVKLIEEFNSLDGIYAGLDSISSKGTQQKLADHRDLAYLSKDLVTIKTDVPLHISIADLSYTQPDLPLLKSLFEELEFTSLLRELGKASAESNTKSANGIEKMPTTLHHPVLKTYNSDHASYTMIDSMPDLDSLLDFITQAQSPTCIDLETSGLDTLSCEIAGLSLCCQPNKAFYIPFNATLNAAHILEKLKPFLENPDLGKGGQNIKFDYKVLSSHGVELQGIVFDTMLASYLINPNSRQHGIDDLAREHLNYQKIETLSLIGKKGKDQKRMTDLPPAEVTPYACEDVDIALQLHTALSPRIKELSLEKVYRDIEIPLIGILGDMERRGVSIDTHKLDTLQKNLEKQIADVRKNIFRLAGEEFNLNSPKQLGPILFEKLRVQDKASRRVKKTKTGYSTDQATLEKYEDDHDIVSYILTYRNLAKLQSTYIEALPKLIHAKTGKIHTSFNQTIAATGRLSSSDPNLQNIPIRTSLGKEIREAFVPSQKDWTLVSADYSQIELRILAHLSKDPGLLEAFHNDVDVHTQTAAKIFQVEKSQVDATLRSRAKAINFGVLYGMGPQRLSRETGVSMDEAKSFIETYFQQFGSIKKYLDAQVQWAKAHGFVATLMGRRRPIPDIHSKNPGIAGNAERMAINTPIQGSAADLIKLAMIKIDQEIKKLGYPAFCLMQVHDELVFECPEKHVNAFKHFVEKCMLNAVKLDVPLKVDVRHGSNWAQAH